jgi:prephenate dehydratase
MKIGIFCLKVCYMNAKIAIQGIKGSFHHQVAQEYYENVVVDECLSLKNW